MSTGYSRAVEGGKPGEYHGYQKDIESVAELIRLWTSRNGRWMSPKFVAGESYGTLRGAALAEHLQSRYGMYLNGLILISQRARPQLGRLREPAQRPRARALPADVCRRGPLPRQARPALAAVRPRRGAGVCRPRLPVGALPGLPADVARSAREAVATLARLSGLTEDYVDRADLRIEHWRYFTELLRDQRLSVGRLDARFTGPAASRHRREHGRRPVPRRDRRPYAAAWNHYVRDELGYGSDLHYEQISRLVHPWSFKDFEGRPVDVSPKLERAMRQNPHLEVHVAYGYYDGATPHFAAEDVVAHLQLPADRLANIEHAYYEAGHMMYVHEPSRVPAERGPRAIRGEELRPRHVDS